eukprot:870747-Amphidinium_carterae.1
MGRSCLGLAQVSSSLALTWHKVSRCTPNWKGGRVCSATPTSLRRFPMRPGLGLIWRAAKW